jgi:general L-amino acid transport system permease protein
MSASAQSNRVPLWRDTRVLKWAAQVLSAVAVIGFVAFFVDNVLDAARVRGLDLGFGFITEAAGFALGESPVSFDASMSFGRAFLVGLLNTLQVALAGIVLATLLGLVAALARLSTNWLVSKLASVYIESIRNVPLLVQLFFWYFAIFQQLPPVREAIQFPGPTFLSQRGLYLPWPRLSEGGGIWLLTLALGIMAGVIAYTVLRRHRIQTGRNTYAGWAGLALVVGIPLMGWFIAGGRPFTLDIPELQRFNFQGGLRLSTEFAALLTGLVIYTGAFIAEVVRAGILAVPRGQVEAARAVGLTQRQILRLVVLPQALRVIIPPLISQYLNLTKNSSLAIAIGYPDLFFVGRTIINQAGRAVPVFLLVMATYLALSLITSGVMNLYDRRVRIVER